MENLQFRGAWLRTCYFYNHGSYGLLLIADHVTELKVAQAQIKKLEQQCLSQKAEVGAIWENSSLSFLYLLFFNIHYSCRILKRKWCVQSWNDFTQPRDNVI